MNVSKIVWQVSNLSVHVRLHLIHMHAWMPLHARMPLHSRIPLHRVSHLRLAVLRIESVHLWLHASLVAWHLSLNWHLLMHDDRLLVLLDHFFDDLLDDDFLNYMLVNIIATLASFLHDEDYDSDEAAAEDNSDNCATSSSICRVIIGTVVATIVIAVAPACHDDSVSTVVSTRGGSVGVRLLRRRSTRRLFVRRARTSTARTSTAPTATSTTTLQLAASFDEFR